MILSWTGITLAYIFIALYTQRVCNLHNRYNKKNKRLDDRFPYDLDHIEYGKLDTNNGIGGLIAFFRWIPGLQLIMLAILYGCYISSKIKYLIKSSESEIYICGKKLHFKKIVKFFRFED